MRKLLLVAAAVVLTAVLSSCQAFFEDYNYSPMQSVSSGSGY